MKDQIPCGMVRDLLPLYVDGLTSEETNIELERHIKDCEPCRLAYQDMRKEVLCEASKNENDAEREINYLKKIRKNNHKKIALAMVGAIMLLLICLAIKLYVIGYPTDAYNVSDMKVEGNGFTCTIKLDGDASYKGWKIINEDDGTQKVVIIARHPSFFSRFHHTQVYIALKTIPSTLDINGNEVRHDGVIVSKLANDLFNAKNKYIGNISADLMISGALGISDSLGGFKNQLQTSDQPYGWTLEFERSVSNPISFDGKMKNYACVLMALIDNIGEVHWSYDIDTGSPVDHHITGMTEAQCSDYVGSPIKSFSESPEKVQQLLDFLEIRN